MKTLLSTLALAAAALVSHPAQAAPEDWEGDPEHVFNSVDHKSCTLAEGGKIQTVTLNVELIAIRTSWDAAMAGKTDAEKAALKKRFLAVATESLDKEWRPRVQEFTASEIDDRIGPYRAAAASGLTIVGNDIQKKTGIETLVGIDAEAVFTPGCTL